MTGMRRWLYFGILTLVFPVCVSGAKFDPWSFRLPVTDYSELKLEFDLNGNGDTDGSVTSTLFSLSQLLSYHQFYQDDSVTLSYGLSETGSLKYSQENTLALEKDNQSVSTRLSGWVSVDRYVSGAAKFYLGGEFRAFRSYRETEENYNEFSVTNYSTKYQSTTRSIEVFLRTGMGKLYDVTLYYRVWNLVRILGDRYGISRAYVPDTVIRKLTGILHRKNEYIRKYTYPSRSSSSNTAWKKHYYADIQKCLETIPGMAGKVNYFLLGSLDEATDEYHPQRRCGSKFSVSASLQYDHFEINDNPSIKNQYYNYSLGFITAQPLSSSLYLELNLSGVYRNELSERLDLSSSVVLGFSFGRSNFLELKVAGLMSKYIINDDWSCIVNGSLDLSRRLAKNLYLKLGITSAWSATIDSSGVDDENFTWNLSGGLEWRLL